MIILSSKSGMFLKSLRMSWHTCMRWSFVFVQQFWHHYCAVFLHAQIISENLPNAVPIHAQLAHLPSSRRSLRIICLTHSMLTWWEPSAPGVVFYVLTSFFKLLALLKDTWAGRRYTCCTIEFKFVCSSEFIDWRPKTKIMYIKLGRKKVWMVQKAKITVACTRRLILKANFSV